MLAGGTAGVSFGRDLRQANAFSCKRRARSACYAAILGRAAVPSAARKGDSSRSAAAVGNRTSFISMASGVAGAWWKLVASMLCHRNHIGLTKDSQRSYIGFT